MVTYSPYIGSWHPVLAVSWDSLTRNWTFIIFPAPEQKAGLCCHWIRGVPVTPTNAVGKIKWDLTSPLWFSLLETPSQIGKLPTKRDIGCHPFQGSISSLPLYSKRHLDGNVGGLMIEGKGEGPRSAVRANPNPNSQPALIVKGAELTLRLKVSRPVWEGSCLWVCLMVVYWLCDEELESRVSCLPGPGCIRVCILALLSPFYVHLSSFLHIVLLENQISNQPVYNWEGRRGRYNLMTIMTYLFSKS